MLDCCKAALCCYLTTSAQGRRPLGRCLTAAGFVSAAKQRRAGRPSGATQPPQSPVAFLSASQPYWKRRKTATATVAQSFKDGKTITSTFAQSIKDGDMCGQKDTDHAMDALFVATIVFSMVNTLFCP